MYLKKSNKTFFSRPLFAHARWQRTSLGQVTFVLLYIRHVIIPINVKRSEGLNTVRSNWSNAYKDIKASAKNSADYKSTATVQFYV
jgi:hypothetical protein